MTHVIRADNLWLFAESRGHVDTMMGEVTVAIVQERRMRWEVASLEVMGRRGMQAQSVFVGCFVVGKWTECRLVEQTGVVGDLVSSDGGITTAM